MADSGITGDYDELERLIGKFRGLSGRLRTVGVRRAAQAIQRVAREQYASGRGPDGEKWTPNKDGTTPPLERLTRQVKFRGDNGVITASGPDKLKYHQRGNWRLPARPPFPDKPGDLPEPWAEAADEMLRRTAEED
ncbi:hypothetical protein BE21_57530 [Sorangium cellulosum]|uniref:Uncharacterized protein n=1 Tax=Sorangium cellulosum TaxID=56 RepID=A0A150U3K4_SORCE|nr:hypothetical protein BE21_57530 [Sorangium cellulosum]